MNAKIQALVGNNIRRFRLATGLTIEELAFRAQLHPNYLGEVERGRVNPTLTNLKKISDGLKRSAADLFAGSRGPAKAANRQTPANTTISFSQKREKDLLELIKALRSSPPKERKRIIKIAKSLNAGLK